MRVVYTMVGYFGEVDCDDETFRSPSVFWLFDTLRPEEKSPKLFLQANVAHSRQSVFPVPVGLSKSALHFCHIIVQSEAFSMIKTLYIGSISKMPHLYSVTNERLGTSN